MLSFQSELDFQSRSHLQENRFYLHNGKSEVVEAKLIKKESRGKGERIVLLL